MRGSQPLRYFHPVVRARRLGTGPLQVRVADRAYALFRDDLGRPAALDDACPHRHAPLSLGRVRPDGHLACPYHGWHFDARGRGKSPARPGLKICDTRAFQVVERYGYLWLAEHDAPLERFPQLNDDAAFEFAGSISTVFHAPLEVALDNVTEAEHFPYVHSTFGWDESGVGGVRVETALSDDHSEVRYAGPQRRTPWGWIGAIQTGDEFHNTWCTRFDPVRTIYTFGWRDARTGIDRPLTTRAAVFLVPEGEAVTRLHMFLFTKIPPSLRFALRAVLHQLTRLVASIELRRDARLMAAVAMAPHDLRGMRLTDLDKALIHNRKLLQRLYRSTAGFDEVVDGGGASERGRVHASE
jgi:phenylpropionate dioxygenase-like ring-hydroxylating dioxygenase large terminal subunit